MQQASLFEQVKTKRPLADELRPTKLSEVVGQAHLLDNNGKLNRFISAKDLPSLIFWGPPGCGKTTIAKLLAKEVNYIFQVVSAVNGSVSDLKKIFAEAKQNLTIGKKTLLMVDEIHRFNRAQQDVFLPYVEDGTITMVGATTENPSFEINAALLSRCQVLVLNRLDTESLMYLIVKAEQYLGVSFALTEAAKTALANLSDGDGRYLLNLCEEVYYYRQNNDELIDEKKLGLILDKRMPIYDKHQESHYNLISALHKSLRGSDVDAALYWFARMLDGGEDPLYIVRRLIRFAVEDIGMADPNALLQANAAKDAYHFIGSPEGELAIAQAVIYLATAPKSNANYVAYKRSVKSAKSNGSLMPPKHILNAPTKLMSDLGYGENYKYDHDEEGGFSGQNYFPDNMVREEYYKPKKTGFEKDIAVRLEYWKKLRDAKN